MTAAVVAERDVIYMRRALQLARNGELHASPNPMVGAVIVAPDGRILGEGWHRRCGSAHAEVNAVAMARDCGATAEELRDATIYVTLEPCSHYGKTPPCAKLLAETGFKRCVVAMTDPNPLVSGRGLKMLEDAGIEVTTGVLEEEARRLNHKFITAQTERRPWITLKWAQSDDGFIDGRRSPSDPPAAISTPVTKTFVHRERALHDAILIGRLTYEADSPSLATTRYAGESPRRFILSRSMEAAPQGWTLLRDASPATLRRLFEEDGIISILVEGGRQVLESFIESGVYDEVRVEINHNLRLAEMPYKASAPMQQCCTPLREKVLHNM